MEVTKRSPIPKDLIFALDIGTRNVVGTIARKIEKTYEVIDYEIMPHPDRAMFDGQIHDIEKVTDVVLSVVQTLEDRNGFRLEKAAIAAAGRALKTEKSSASRMLDFTKEIDKQMMDSLEMEAIQIAQKVLMQDAHKHANYYCVGYSVINYFLDQSLIMNPVGHKGSNIEVEVIATFLPHIVVDSLYAVIQRAGLEVLNLTLEPIAAMNVTIPPKLRLLNLALVDVGAGTSDIAISRDGTVESYGMVAIAGDKITEQIAQHYLLDFNMAEVLKVNLASTDTHEIINVLGMQQTLSTEEVLKIIEPTVEKIATRISDQIMLLNKKAPSAVFCVGGGSQIPGFMNAIADKLSLPKERVALKMVEQLENVRFMGEALEGPEFITPIGIGVTAFTERSQDFVQVSVNDNIMRLFKAKTLHVSDALIIAGVNARSLLAERGPSFEIVFNGEPKTIRGDFGEPAKIFINGMSASLDSMIKHKDQIIIEPASKGKVAEPKLSRLINYDSRITFREQSIKIIETVSVNGVDRTGDYTLKPDDVIETKGIRTLRQLCELFELDSAYVDFLKNGEKTSMDATLKHGDTVDYELISSNVSSDASELNRTIVQEATDNGIMTFIVNGEPITVNKHPHQMVFVDIFNHIDFDISEAKGIILLKLNGERANYTDILKDGDVIDISWQK